MKKAPSSVKNPTHENISTRALMALGQKSTTKGARIAGGTQILPVGPMNSKGTIQEGVSLCVALLPGSKLERVLHIFKKHAQMSPLVRKKVDQGEKKGFDRKKTPEKSMKKVSRV